ncbi:hypothetical protein ACFPPF_12220 [Xenophilus aerolatus]|nr:hypothetical protein [Xenophilus aerolatus]
MHSPDPEKNRPTADHETASSAGRTVPADRPAAHVAFVRQAAAPGELVREGVVFTAEGAAGTERFILQLIVTQAHEIKFELHPAGKPQHFDFDALAAVLERSRVLLLRHVLDDESLSSPIEC